MVGKVIQIVTEKLSSLPFIEGIVLGGLTCKKHPYRKF